MIPYKSKSGKSAGVTGYRQGADYIIVQFGWLKEYTYPVNLNDVSTIEKMKALAGAQKGLSTFISKNNPVYSKIETVKNGKSKIDV